ncbi:MAG: type II secretion system F family protein [Phycisphaerales bacterium]
MSALTFEFRALTPDGSMHHGITQADSCEDAYRRIAASGMKPVKIAQASRRRTARMSRSKITRREISQFTFQFAVMIEARIPISEGLRSIAVEEQNPAFRRVIEEVATSIGAGSTITEALTPHRHVFGDVYVEMIRSAEQSGNLVKILQYLADLLERDIDRQASLRSALMYPSCVLTALAAAVVVVMLVVMPRFVRMFEAQGVNLPMPTRVLLGMTQIFNSYWWVFALLLAVAIGAVLRLRRTDNGRRVLDRLLHRIPVIRSALQAAALARFAHVFGISLDSGLSLIDCLDMSGRASGRAMMREDARRMAAHVSEGGNLAEALTKCPYVTGFTRRLLSAGEQSAEMSSTCRIIARHYDRELKYLTKNMATLIEPFVVVAMAGVVLFVALSIFLPMWNMMSLMQ